MTSKRQETQTSRALMELKGITYTSALRQVRDGGAGYQANPSVRAEVMSAPVNIPERLQGPPLEAAGNLLSVNIYAVRDAVVQSIDLRQSTIDWRSTTDPGTVPGSLAVHSKAELVWKRRLSLAHGPALIDAGLAEFIDADLGDGTSLARDHTLQGSPGGLHGNARAGRADDRRASIRYGQQLSQASVAADSNSTSRRLRP